MAATAAAAALGTNTAGAASADSNYTTDDQRIESWDGTELAATLYLPDGTYFARAPTGTGESGQATFGQVEYSTDGGQSWTLVAGSTDQNVLLGVDQP